MKVRHAFALMLMAVAPLATWAQTAAPTSGSWASRLWTDVRSNAFKHLDLSVTTGTTGVGFDVSVPVGSMVDVRAGWAAMPHFTHTMHFGVEVGDDPTTSQSKFDRLSGLLTDFTGNKVDNQIDMDGMPTYWNWKVLVDVKPLRNKHWHVTAGLFMGSRQIAKAVNTVEDMTSLMAVSIYNNLYNKAMNGEPLTTIGNMSLHLEELEEKVKEYGMMSIHLGDYKHDVLYTEDVVAEEAFFDYENDIFYEAGDIIHHKGDVMTAKGSPYRIVPDENSMVKAWAYANRLKPYIGFGYGGRLLKRDPSWQVSFDCGAMFWGGTPSIVTHDGTDLVNDVTNIRGKVGDYVDIIKVFKVMPVLNVRITKRIF